MTSERVLLVINSLGTGGAERVLANLVAARKVAPEAEVHLALLDDLTPMRTVAPLDGYHVLDGRGSLLRSAWQLRRLVGALKPDVMVGFLIRSNCAIVLASTGTPIRTIVCERMHTASHLVNNHGVGIGLIAARSTIRWLYPRADRVLAVSDGVRGNLIEQFRVLPSRVMTLPNPYDLAAIRAAGAQHPQRELPDDYCICVSRLVAAKDVATVLRSFAVERPTRDIVIVGEGPLHDSLRTLGHQLGIADHVHFTGFLANPYPVISRARFLVSASQNEGFPNAAAEAMALGVPVALTDCPSGPAELLVNGRYGLLIPLDNPAAFSSALRRMADPAERAQFSALGKERMEAFGLLPVARAYWNEFCSSQRAER
ncbi:MAG: glycosyltransferase [bacterium]|nr:glycosyltransferase [bacterium]